MQQCMDGGEHSCCHSCLFASHVCACGRLHLRRVHGCNYQWGVNGQPATTFRMTQLLASRKYSMDATVLPMTSFLSYKNEHTLSASRQFAFTTMPVIPDRSSSMLRVYFVNFEKHCWASGKKKHHLSVFWARCLLYFEGFLSSPCESARRKGLIPDQQPPGRIQALNDDVRH